MFLFCLHFNSGQTGKFSVQYKNYAEGGIFLNNLRRDFERFCYRYKNKGVPNLMLYVVLGNLMVYLFSLIDPSGLLMSVLSFNRDAILSGQVWRLLTYIFIPTESNILFMAIMMFFYFQIGRLLEHTWGTFRFNLYYFTGVVLTAAAAMIFNVYANASYLNLSLILAYATTCPENRVYLLFIPIKMKYLAWFYFVSIIATMLTSSMGMKIFVLAALANYFIFMNSDIKGVLPSFMQGRPKQKKQTNTTQGNPGWANKYRNSSGEAPYRHKCTVCGKTDTQYPELEFRYCSQCDGYHCYCMEHINNHDHIKS